MYGVDDVTARVIFHDLINRSGPPVIIVEDKWGQHMCSESGEAPGHVAWGEEDAGLPAWDKPLADITALTVATPAKAPPKPAVTPPEPPRAPVARRSIQRIANAFDSLWGKQAKPPAPTPVPTRRRIQT